MCYNILLACLAFFEKILKAFKTSPVSYCLISHNRQQRDGSENLPQRNQKWKPDKWQTHRTVQSIIRNTSETFPPVRAAHIKKERGTPKHITHKDSMPEQLPKRPHRGHYTVAKNVNTQEKVITSTVQNKTNHEGWKTEDKTTNYK